MFKGTGSIGKIAKKLGMKGISLDSEDKYEPDILSDILAWDYKKWQKETGFVPDLLWASPPCNTFSTLAYPFKERDTKTAEPKSERARVGTQILYKTLQIIDFFKSINPKLLYVIENPRGMMRHDKRIKKLPNNNTTLYCLYGDVRRKPTDFFNNVPDGLDLKPPEMTCKGKKLVGVVDLPLDKRYAIPPKLVRDILTRMVEAYNKKTGSGAYDHEEIFRGGSWRSWLRFLGIGTDVLPQGRPRQRRNALAPTPVNPDRTVSVETDDDRGFDADDGLSVYSRRSSMSGMGLFGMLKGSGYSAPHLKHLMGGRLTPEEIAEKNRILQEAFEARKRAPPVLTPEQQAKINEGYNKEIEDDSRKDWTSYHFKPQINPETGQQETIEEQEIRIRTGSDQGAFAPRFYEDGTRESLSDRQTRINETIENNKKVKAQAEYIRTHPYFWRGEYHDKPEGFWSSFGHVFTDQITDPNSLIRGSLLPIASTVLGSIPVVGTAIKGLNYANEGAKLLGYGDEEEEGKKKGKKKGNKGAYVRYLIATKQLDPARVSDNLSPYLKDLKEKGRKGRNKERAEKSLSQLRGIEAETKARNEARKKVAPKAVKKYERKKAVEDTPENMTPARLYALTSGLSKTNLKKLISTMNRVSKLNDKTDYYTIRFAPEDDEEKLRDEIGRADPSVFEYETILPLVKRLGFRGERQERSAAERITSAQNKRDLKKVVRTVKAKFGVEMGGISGADGIGGFVDTLLKHHPPIHLQSQSKSARDKIARATLKQLFPDATKFDSLSVSAFSSPSQTDGGIEISQTADRSVKGSLIYENTEYPTKDRKEIVEATEKAISVLF